MTMIAARVDWPPQMILGGPTAIGGVQSDTFDATNDQVALVATAIENVSIKVVYVRVGTITTAAVMRVGFYELGTDGRPGLTPTLWSANSTGAAPYGDTTISGSNTWQTFTMTNEAILVAGDQFAIVLSYVSGSTPSFSVQHASSAITNPLSINTLQIISNAGGAYASAVQTPFLWILESTTANDVRYMPGTLPVNGGATLSAFNTGTVDERGMKFVPPFKCRVIGLRIGMANIGAATSFLGALYDSTDQTTTTLAVSPAYDGDEVIATTTDGYYVMYFTTPYTLAAGTTYYASVRNTTATAASFVELTTATVTNAIRAFGIGTNTVQGAARTYGAPPTAWSVTTTTFPCIQLIIDQLDDGAGGGGMLFVPNLSGT